jgi:hypothetical protein
MWLGDLVLGMEYVEMGHFDHVLGMELQVEVMESEGMESDSLVDLYSKILFFSSLQDIEF